MAAYMTESVRPHETIPKIDNSRGTSMVLMGTKGVAFAAVPDGD